MSIVPRTVSTATIAAVGLLSKSFLNLGCSHVDVDGLDVLLSALQGGDRGRGILTVSNHISVLDDPLIWGILPTYTYFEPRLTRWTLGASDIMFTNPVFSAFFRAGQVLETLRGAGVNQTAVDDAIDKLNQGAWVHIFPEGRVNQPSTNPVGGLLPFKWGIGRMIMEAKSPPYIIPMCLRGFDSVMSEPRAFPAFLPRFRQRVGVTIARDVKLNDAVSAFLAAWKMGGDKESEAASTRSMITAVIQESVENLKHHVRSID